MCKKNREKEYIENKQNMKNKNKNIKIIKNNIEKI